VDFPTPNVVTVDAEVAFPTPKVVTDDAEVSVLTLKTVTADAEVPFPTPRFTTDSSAMISNLLLLLWEDKKVLPKFGLSRIIERMASNQIPKSPIERIFALAEDMAHGAATQGTGVGLVQNTETTTSADLSAARAAESAFQAARAAKQAKSAAQQVADSNAKAFIAATKNILAITLGNKWSAEWAAAGWNDPTLAVPTSTPARLGVLPAIKAYFTANPTKENAPAGVTAAQADAIHTALASAVSATNAANTASGQAKAARDGAVEKLRQRMIGLVRELTQLIPGDDPRWYAFGLNRPDDPNLPAVATGLVATPGGPGILLVDWADARRAERYKVETLIPPSADWTEAAQVAESEATLTGLPTGSQVKLRILSANPAGYAQPSEEITVTVP
jgi:hypothetical protein